MDRPRTSKPNRLRSGLLAGAVVTLAVGALVWHLVFSDNTAANTMDQQRDLARKAADWVRAERDVQRPLASPLAPSELEIFGPFFPQEVLDEVRVRAVVEMPEPAFADSIRYHGKKIFNIRRARGLALNDTLLLRGENVPAGSPSRQPVLFHELVHAVQYRAFGVDSFFEHYFASLVENQYSYRHIVFENQAFELADRFMAHQDQPFSVALEVERLFAELSSP